MLTVNLHVQLCQGDRKHGLHSSWLRKKSKVIQNSITHHDPRIFTNIHLHTAIATYCQLHIYLWDLILTSYRLHGQADSREKQGSCEQRSRKWEWSVISSLPRLTHFLKQVTDARNSSLIRGPLATPHRKPSCQRYSRAGKHSLHTRQEGRGNCGLKVQWLIVAPALITPAVMMVRSDCHCKSFVASGNAVSIWIMTCSSWLWAPLPPNKTGQQYRMLNTMSTVSEQNGTCGQERLSSSSNFALADASNFHH